MRRDPTSWGLRLGAVLLLIAVHVGVWRPVRDVLIEEVAGPVAAALDTAQAERVTLGFEPRTVIAQAGGEVYRYRAPASLGYLVVAIVLIGLFPRRWYWLWLWLAQLALGGLAFGAFLWGIGWADLGLTMADFIQAYLDPALNLLALALALAPRAFVEERA